MTLDNLVKIVVYYFLIKEMTYLDRWDKFSIVSALVCIVTHWARSTVNQDIRLSDCHDSPNYYVVWTLNFERILNLWWNQHITLTYGWNPKVVIYFLWIRSLLVEASNNRYSQWRYHDILWDWDSVSFWII